MLAVLHGLEKFDYYTCARKTEVITDHKSLIEIFQKDVHLAPPRLQCLLLRVKLYDCTITYRKGKSMFLSDALSRNPKHESDAKMSKPIPGLDVQVHDIQTEIPLNSLQTIAQKAANDATLKQVMAYTLTGWPDSADDLPAHLKPFHSIHASLACHNGVLVYGSRVIVPTCLRQNALTALHAAHFSVEKMQMTAAERIYWPNI